MGDMENIDDIQNWPIIKFENQLKKLSKKFSDDLSILESELLKAQETCSHKQTRYCPDPSGNNDSYTECDWCGKGI